MPYAGETGGYLESFRDSNILIFFFLKQIRSSNKIGFDFSIRVL